mmetsp:Transcript_3993/g.3339  ORF Transcript_3993/g.3339 Transcript_3993/m.3339 type:complete len:216 (-) Transcript_3993:80-727(-)|eukprot:CAMPEP_0205832990 /NCGR_PEP_ID=MMETSP0206-20130828/48482_1 /ASSEMBLY_ACC=CAM_ASM_000279 /TAXON_ID=36767 /ORGANISM="Euplotes focardii, Strain TN1" /LENGTH=215 /DNA_ID=CAMNT_0053138997 /DNA_START=459 /DNA_END=1106 /DNA_ORIENTATION=-
MNLLGHSFGAFVSSKYALKYPKKVNKLMFFSPWASESCDEDKLIEFNEHLESLPVHVRLGIKWSKNATPFGVARKAGRWIGGFLVKKFIRRRFGANLEGEELEAIAEYLEQIIMRDGSSEYAFRKMFPFFQRSDRAISNYLDEYKKLGVEISFYYGTDDWMNTSFNGLHVSQQLENEGEKVYIIEDAGHHIYFCNPEDAFDKIYEDFSTSKKILI